MPIHFLSFATQSYNDLARMVLQKMRKPFQYIPREGGCEPAVSSPGTSVLDGCAILTLDADLFLIALVPLKLFCICYFNIFIAAR